MFHVIPEAYAITRTNGVFRQVPVFKYKNRLFLKHGNGFIWVLKSGDTSSPHVRLDEIELPFKETYNRLGYLCTPEAEDEPKGKK